MFRCWPRSLAAYAPVSLLHPRPYGGYHLLQLWLAMSPVVGATLYLAPVPNEVPR